MMNRRFARWLARIAAVALIVVAFYAAWSIGRLPSPPPGVVPSPTPYPSGWTPVPPGRPALGGGR